MRVNTVGSSTAFKERSLEEKFAKLGNDDLKVLAYEKAKLDTNDKKHNRIDKAIYLSLPLAAGVAKLAENDFINKKELYYALKEAGKPFAERISIIKRLAESGEKVLNPSEIRAFKFMKGAGAVVSWTTMLAAFSAVWMGKIAAEKKSKTMRDLSQHYPFLTTVGTFAAGVLASMGVDKGVAVAAKALKKKIPYNSLKESLKNTLNNSKVLNKAANVIAKVPSPIRSIGKGALVFLPFAMIVTSFIHSMNHDAKKMEQARKNFNDFKVAQQMIKEDLKSEKSEKAEETEA